MIASTHIPLRPSLSPYSLRWGHKLSSPGNAVNLKSLEERMYVHGHRMVTAGARRACVWRGWFNVEHRAFGENQAFRIRNKNDGAQSKITRRQMRPLARDVVMADAVMAGRNSLRLGQCWDSTSRQTNCCKFRQRRLAPSRQRMATPPFFSTVATNLNIATTALFACLL